MFCSLHGFGELVVHNEPLYVSIICINNVKLIIFNVLNKSKVFDVLNQIYKMFDERISHFDVHKVESINEKYMVASGVPTPNGNIKYTVCITIRGLHN